MPARGKTVQLNNMHVADFETCDLYPDTDIDDQRVWLAGLKNLESGKEQFFNNLHDFMQTILSRGNNVNSEIAFHNLKFDGSFIVPYLINQGYTHNPDKPKKGEFSVLVDDRNNWYTITIQVTQKRRVLIWDSFKLFPTALRYLPDVYSTPTRKIEEDKAFYERSRPVDHEPTQQELDYMKNDLRVPFEVLNKHIELFGLRFKKTQAGQSFYNFEQSFKWWKWRFPPLTTNEHEQIKPAYWGGISYVPPSKVGKDYYHIGSYDINSSYPDKVANKKLPYGDCVLELGEGSHPDMSKFWVAEVLISFELKPNHVPCIPSKAILEGREKEIDKWVPNSNGVVKIALSHIDYLIINQSYDFKIYRWLWSKHWKWKKHKEMKRFVDENNTTKVEYRKKAKEEKDKSKRVYYEALAQRAKIDNNSFYGKFGEDIIKYGKTPHPTYDGIDWVQDRVDEQSTRKRKYLPVAIAITAWGRKQLVEMGNTLGEHFLYCDTDSVHYLLEGQYKVDQAIERGDFIEDDTALGAWKLEGKFYRGRYLRAKCYMEETYNGEKEATVAGLPADPGTGQFSKSRSVLTWDNFYIGLYIPKEKANKLRTIRTRTGNKLEPTDFTITEKLKFY